MLVAELFRILNFHIISSISLALLPGDSMQNLLFLIIIYYLLLGQVKLITGLAGPSRIREKGTASPYFIDILPRFSILFYPIYPSHAVLLINSLQYSISEQYFRKCTSARCKAERDINKPKRKPLTQADLASKAKKEEVTYLYIRSYTYLCSSPLNDFLFCLCPFSSLKF